MEEEFEQRDREERASFSSTSWALSTPGMSYPRGHQIVSCWSLMMSSNMGCMAWIGRLRPWMPQVTYASLEGRLRRMEVECDV